MAEPSGRPGLCTLISWMGRPASNYFPIEQIAETALPARGVAVMVTRGRVPVVRTAHLVLDEGGGGRCEGVGVI